MRLLLGLTLCLVALSHGAVAQTGATPPLPSDAEVRTILAQRIDAHKQSVGIVVGIVEPHARRVIAHGRPGKGNDGPLDGDTLYEIGSITKVFTALLLADMAQRGEVRLDDAVAKHLPAEVQGAAARRSGDHAGGSCHAYVGAAAHAREFPKPGPRQSLCRLHRRPALRSTFRRTS